MNVALRPSINFISLCTGGGGLDLGIELAMPSARPIVLVEREAFAAAHLVAAMQQGLLAQAPIWSDVTTFNGRPWRGLVDGLISGIPCQPHSLAGKRLAEEDERDLWSDARRIIVQSGAWFVLIENVRGMVTSGGFERVWRDLLRLGFEVESGLFTAAEVGASHQRERLFILAVADRGAGGSMGNSVSSGYDGRPDDTLGRSSERTAIEGPSRSAIGAMGDINVVELRREPSARQLAQLQSNDGHGEGYLFPPGPSDLSGWRGVLEKAPELEPAFRRVADGLASRLDIARVDRLRMLGNGVVSLEGAYAFSTLATRLAARDAAGAVRLIRMMEAAE